TREDAVGRAGRVLEAVAGDDEIPVGVHSHAGPGHADGGRVDLELVPHEIGGSVEWSCGNAISAFPGDHEVFRLVHGHGGKVAAGAHLDVVIPARSPRCLETAREDPGCDLGDLVVSNRHGHG